MKLRIIVVLGCLLLVLAATTETKAQYLIRAADHWTSPVMSESSARNLALYQIVVVDGENIVNNRESLELIKQLNSDIKLICYSNPMELFSLMMGPQSQMTGLRPQQTALAQEIKEKYPQWLLRSSSGKNVVFYPGMIMLNLSTNCPRINGKNCAEYMAEKELEILKDTIWDGHYMDNATNTISWVDNQIDSNNDGIPDDSLFLDQAWSAGVHSYLSLVKKGMRKGNLLFGNKGITEFMDVLNSRMFEDFPNNYLGGIKDFGWHKSMSNARQTGKYTIFLVKSKDLMFGLASALLTDNVYIAIDQNNPRIHPELNLDLGKPLSRASKNDVCYFRLYEKGMVEVFPSQRKGIITLNK